MPTRDFARRAGHLLRALFGVPFFALGLFFLFSIIRHALTGDAAEGAPKTWLIIPALFALVFAGVGAAIVVSSLRKALGAPPPAPPAETPRALDEKTREAFPEALPKPKGPGKAAVLLPLLLGGIFAAAGIGMLAVAGYKVNRVREAAAWVETPCTVLNSDVTSHSGSKGGTTYSVAVRFTYRYADRDYDAATYSFDTGSSSGYEDKADIVRKLPPGARAICFVNPADPTEAVMDRSMPSIVWILGGMGPFFAFAGFAVMGAPLYARRKKARELASGKGVELAPETTRWATAAGTLFAALFWNGITAVFVTFAVKSVNAGRPEWFLIVFITPFVLIGAFLLYAAVGALFAPFKPRVKLVPQNTPRAGETLRLKWDANGREPSLRRLRISLEGFEYAVTGSGKQRTNREIIFHRSDLLDSEGRPARAGTLEAPIPRTLPHSLELTGTAGVRWRIRVQTESGLPPKLNETYRLHVAPARSEANPFAE